MGRQLSAADSVRNVGISGAEALQGHVDLMIADNDRLPDQPQQTPEITPDGKINPRAKDYEAVTWEESFESYVKRHKPELKEILERSGSWRQFHEGAAEYGLRFQTARQRPCDREFKG